MSFTLKTFFDSDTATFTHVASDPHTSAAAIIDSVLDYDQFSGRSTTKSADGVIEYITQNNLKVEWILETHIHADHLTASRYLQGKLGGKTAIGSHIKDVLELWVPIFNTHEDTDLEASQFDCLLEDNQVIKLGDLEIKILHTPGHTPSCVSYLIEDAVFVGDLIFMPDVGGGRTDFPGGSAQSSYDSIRRILSLPDETRIYSCHDYPPQGREAQSQSTVAQQKKSNCLVNETVSKDAYVSERHKRDEGKPVPKLLLPSIQANLRLGTFGQAESNGVQYIKIPVNKI